jgi:membrane-associated protease RseP (regulator of RpoE activity)
MDVSAANIVFSLLAALILHELGHFVAARACRISVTQLGFGWGPKLFRAEVSGIEYCFRVLPVGAYVRLDMGELQKRPLIQQLTVLLAGVAVNLLLALIGWGSFFGIINLALAIGNLFPLYQFDGWKTGMVIFRRVFKGKNPLVEWSFTISAGIIGLAIVASTILWHLSLVI